MYKDILTMGVNLNRTMGGGGGGGTLFLNRSTASLDSRASPEKADGGGGQL